MHALPMLTFPVLPSDMHPCAPSLWSPVFSLSLQCRPRHSCRGHGTPPWPASLSSGGEKPALNSYLREHYGSSTQKLVREHERSLHKRAHCSNHHIFSMRCRDKGVLPTSLRIRPPVKTREGYRIAEQASRASLSARIRETHRSKRDLSSKIRTLQSQLQSKLEVDDYQKVIRLSYAAAESTHAKAKLNHTRKLDRLRDSRDKHRELRPQGLERWVINLTN